MSVSTTTSFDHASSYDTASSMDCGLGSSHSQDGQSENVRSELNEAADEEAFRLRSEGMTFREIANVMGVDPSMAHRRVKRQLSRQKRNLSDRQEEVREIELEKLRWIEQALLPDAKSGDYTAIKIVLRIMDMRRKYLKDIPPERAEQVAWPGDDDCEVTEQAGEVATEETGQANVDASNGKHRGQTSVDRDRAQEIFSRLSAESEQPLAEAGVTTTEEGSTKGSTPRSPKRPKAIVRKARRKKRSRRR